MALRRLAGIAAALVLASTAHAADWPQAQNDAARTGRSGEELHGPFTFLWQADYTPEVVAHRVQPICYQGRVYVGTRQGNLYAHEEATGKVAWVFRAGGAILHSVACTDGKAIFGCEDGKVYAVHCATGEIAWSVQTDWPFLTTPLLAEGLAVVANIGGQVFAFRPANGEVAWQVELGAPCYHSAAYADGRIFLGADDMFVRCLRADTGKEVWRSPKLLGVTLKDYWPLVHKGRVIVRPQITFDAGSIYWGGRAKWGGWTGGPPEEMAQVRAGKMPPALLAAQEKMIQYFTQKPRDKDVYLLDAATGQEAAITPLYLTNVMDGCCPPPAVDYQGKLIVPVEYYRNRWGRYDIDANRVTEILLAANVDAKAEPPSGNPDESLAISCAGSLAFIFHIEEANAHCTGVIDLATRQYQSLQDSRGDTRAQYLKKAIFIHGPQAPAEAWRIPISHNNQNAAHAAAIANGRIFHIQHTYSGGSAVGGGMCRLGAWGAQGVSR